MIDLNSWIYINIIQDNRFDTILLLSTLVGVWIFKALENSNPSERGFNIVASTILIVVAFLILCTKGILAYMPLIIMSIAFIYVSLKVASGDWFK